MEIHGMVYKPYTFPKPKNSVLDWIIGLFR